MQRHGRGEEAVARPLACLARRPAGVNFGAKALAFGELRAGAQPRALEGGVAIARIDDPWLALGIEPGDKAGFRKAEQRAQQATAGELADRRHPGKAGGAAAGPPPDQIGLDLILLVMRKQQVQATPRAAPGGQKLVARRAGGLLDAARRPPAGPDENLVADAAFSQPCAEASQLGIAARAQAMIDRERADLAAMRARPAVGKERQRKAVGAAGSGDGQ